jgi:hypothetical protein
VDNTKEKLYPKGTLVKIEKLSAPSGPVDISIINMYGYVTHWWTAPVTGRSYYVISTFPNNKKLNLPEHYLSPVSRIE